MDTIRAIYEHGVIRPIGPVSLPESCEIEFEPRVVQSKPNSSPAELYRLLDQRFNSGQHDIAARHNEHQP